MYIDKEEINIARNKLMSTTRAYLLNRFKCKKDLGLTYW